MINYTESIEEMLNNILIKTTIIQNDFLRNGEVYYDYILEKLSSAKNDLDILINMAKDIKWKEENRGEK